MRLPSAVLLLALALSMLPSRVTAGGIITDIFNYAADVLFPPEEYIDPASNIKSLNIGNVPSVRVSLAHCSNTPLLFKCKFQR